MEYAKSFRNHYVKPQEPNRPSPMDILDLVVASWPQKDEDSQHVTFPTFIAVIQGKRCIPTVPNIQYIALNFDLEMDNTPLYFEQFSFYRSSIWLFPNQVSTK